jgi:hypothetical protein
MGRRLPGTDVSDFVVKHNGPFSIIGRSKQTFEEMAKDRNLDPEEIRPVYEKLLDELVKERDKQKVLKVKYEEVGK